MKLIKISVLTTPTTANVERRFSVLTFVSTKLRNTLAPNPLDKLMQLISLEHYIYDLDRDEIIPEKTAQHSTKLTKLKIYASSLFSVMVFVSMLLNGKILLP